MSATSNSLPLALLEADAKGCWSNGVSAAGSAERLSHYQAVVDDWKSAHLQSTAAGGPPKFGSYCKLTHPDALTAAGTFESALEWKINTATHNATEQTATFNNNMHLGASNDATPFALMAVAVILAALFGVSRRIYPLSRLEKRLVAEGHQDRWASYRDFMNDKLRVARRVEFSALGVIAASTIIAFLAGGPIASAGVSWALLGAIGIPVAIYGAVIHLGAMEEARQRGIIFMPKLPPKVQFAPPRPAAQAEHGSARHAADAELHAKGFAERENGSPVRSMESVLAGMTDAELKRFGALSERDQESVLQSKGVRA